jgi:hypothetical protein
MENPWDGLQDGLVCFIISHAVLATFFSSDRVGQSLNTLMWLVLILFGSTYFALRMKGFIGTGDKETSGEVDESERSLIDDQDESDIETDEVDTHRLYMITTIY